MIELILFFISATLCISLARKSGLYSIGTIFSCYWLSCIGTFLLFSLGVLDVKSRYFSAVNIANDYASVSATTTAFYSVLIALAYAASLGIHRPRAIAIGEATVARDRILSALSTGPLARVATLAIVLRAGAILIHAMDMDFRALWSSNGRLWLNQPEIFGIEFGPARVVHRALMYIGFACATMVIPAFARSRSLGISALCVASYAFVVALATSSRSAAIFPVLMGTTTLMIYGKRRLLGSVLLFGVGLLSYFEVMVARSRPIQGLSTLFSGSPLIEQIGMAHTIFGLWTSMTSSALGFAWSIILGKTHQEIYKILSFSPLLSSMDGFAEINRLYLLKLNAHGPYNAFSEAYLFGLPYTVLYLLCTFCWLRIGIRLSIHRSIYLRTLSFTFLPVIILMAQYPIRSSFRLMLVEVIVGAVALRVERNFSISDRNI